MQGPCPEFNLFRHVLVTGGTGCGKTVSVVLPLLERALRKHAQSADQKAALFIVDVKGDLTVPVRALAKRFGRDSDLLELSMESPAVTNLLTELSADPFTGAQLLTTATYQRAGFADIGKENGFWQIGMLGYVASALAWLQFLRQPITASNINLLVGTDARSGWEFPNGFDFPADHIELCVSRLRKSPELSLNQLAILLDRLRELRSADFKTRSNFLSCLTQLTEALAHPLAQIVTSEKPTWTPGQWLSEGKIILVRLPFAADAAASNFIARLLKMSLYRRVLTRFNETSSDAPRPAFFFLDEAHRFATSDGDSGDQFFIDRCRAMNAGCVYATQSIAALSGVFAHSHLDNFLANINTRVFGRSLDQTTATIAASLLGQADMIADYRGSSVVLTPDPDPELPPQPTFQPMSRGDRRVSAADLAMLNTGEFYVAEGAANYRWEATLPEHFGTSAMLGFPQPAPVPSFFELPATAEIQIPAPASPQKSEENEVPEAPPAVEPPPAATPLQEPPSPPLPAAAKKTYTRPAWLPKKESSEDGTKT